MWCGVVGWGAVGDGAGMSAVGVPHRPLLPALTGCGEVGWGGVGWGEVGGVVVGFGEVGLDVVGRERRWEGYCESRRCSKHTYAESDITKYTSIRRQAPSANKKLADWELQTR